METENTDVLDLATKHENNPRKRVRHRKKQIYENIMKQMEFYFSDANLSKDRFLGGLVNNDPFVPVVEFLKFNKVRALTQDANDIVKAMKHSTLLELSDDKQKVKRKTPMMPYNADLRTVYVESIPVTASREWLERVFSDYGQVAYISLPKFKNTNKIKGFAFIEFTKPQDANNCLNAFNKMGCKLPSCMPPDDLSSIKMFNVDNNEENADNNDHPENNHDSNTDNITNTKEEYEPPKKKAKKRDKKPPKTLELKQDQESDNEKKTPTEEFKPVTTPSEEGKTTDIEQESKDELTIHDEGKASDSTQRKKKTKKRSAKEKSKVKALAKGEAPKGALWGLQVLPKLEWKSLRNKYLNLQRKHMKDIKNNLRKAKHTHSGIPDPAAPAMEAEPGKSASNETAELRKQHRMHLIEKTIHSSTKYSSQALSGAKTVEPLQKIPGVFVKQVLSEPCLDVRLTKKTIKTNIYVEHVDAKPGQSEVIIRFQSSKAADEYCANLANRARVLCGAEEQEQWQLADSARANKRVRGRTRLLARAAALHESPALTAASPQPTHTHIRFDDE